jgi:cyclase
MSGLTKRIIPCLDVKNGRVVKGVKFQNLRDMGDPVELALRYEAEGADELVLLDIAASVESRQTALTMVRQVSRALSIPFTLGGGLRSLHDIGLFLEAGADKVCFNSAAIAQPTLLDQSAAHFGSQCIVLAIDSRKIAGQDQVFTMAGSQPTGLTTVSWAREAVHRGVGEILLTSIDRDGGGEGYDLDVLGRVVQACPVPVIASGGASDASHLLSALQAGAQAVLAASMFHSGIWTIAAVKHYLSRHHLPIRSGGPSC